VRERQHVEVEATAREAPSASLTARTTLCERVLSLQRVSGNAAVGRLLRQIAQPDEVTELKAPVQIDRYDVIIKTVTGPGLKPSGEYDWGVTYQLPFPADTDGWMIQELFMDGSASAAGVHFWECWKVRSGKREPEDRGEYPYDDHYVSGNVPGATQSAAGWRRHVGVIRFYPGALPPEFGKEDPDQAFYHTKTTPTGWTGAGTRHDAYSEWDRSHNGFVGYAGSTEVREGDPVTFRPRARTANP
jgi:hypothetical protein